MSTTQRFILVSAVLIAAATVTLAVGSARPQTDGDGVAEEGPRRVRVEPASHLQATESVVFSGVTRGAKSAMASFTIGGRLARRSLEIGDRVHKGQTIAVLDDREFRNSLAAARASLHEIDARLAQAGRDVERSEALLDRDAATREEVEKVKSAREALEAQRRSVAARVGELERRVDETLLRSPIDGTVSEVFLEPGEYATPGRPVAALSGDHRLEVEVELPEAMIADLGLGDAVEVRFPLFRGLSTEGRVTSLGSSTLGPGRLFPVIITLETGGSEAGELMPGLTAEVALERRPRGRSAAASLAVPVDALLDPGGQDPYLYAVRDGVARKLPVDIDRLVGERVIVAGELAAGELVVVEGHVSLLDGDEVEILAEAVEVAS